MNIESLTNVHVKEWTKLKEKKGRDQAGLFLIEGEHLIEEAQKQNVIKEIISTDPNEKADFYVTKSIMKKISSQVSIPTKIAVCLKQKENHYKNKILILDNIQDPGNLGTMIRSALAFGFSDIVLGLDTVDLYNEKVIRASEGMLFHINILRRDLNVFLEEIKKDYQILLTDVKKGKNIKTIPIQEKVALVIGSEGNGIKEEFQKYATTYLKINMEKSVESLNAAVAASILMYEIGASKNE